MCMYQGLGQMLTMCLQHHQGCSETPKCAYVIYGQPLSILTVKEAANPQLTSLTTAAAPSAGEPLQKKQMRIIFVMDGEYLDQHNYQIKTFIFQSHNNTNRPLHSKDFVYLSDIIKLLNNKEMK